MILERLRHWLDLLRFKPEPPTPPPLMSEDRERMDGQLREAVQLNASSARLVGKVAEENTRGAKVLTRTLNEMQANLAREHDVLAAARASLDLISSRHREEGQNHAPE